MSENFSTYHCAFSAEYCYLMNYCPMQIKICNDAPGLEKHNLKTTSVNVTLQVFLLKYIRYTSASYAKLRVMSFSIFVLLYTLLYTIAPPPH